ADMAEKQQIARVYRHSKMIDPAARGNDRLRDHIAPVEDCRRAVDQHDLYSVPDRITDQRCELRCRMVAAFLDNELATEGLEPSLGDLAGFVEDAFLQARETRLDQPHRARDERCDAQQRFRLAG